MNPEQPALFVSHASSLQPAGGGVQRCTREYAAVLTAAGYKLTYVSYVNDRVWLRRLRKKLFPQPYQYQLPPSFAGECAAKADQIGARWIFLNHGDTAPIAATLAARYPGKYRFALLSHGLDSTDYLHEIRIRAARIGARQTNWLGKQLFAEMSQRRHLDVVFCLSPTDLGIEKWLGAKRVRMVPRIIADQPLALAPVSGRIGTVSTLDHPPNHEGIVLFAAALQRHPGVTLRLVGGPRDFGETLARRFAHLTYLGPLGDAPLAAEAATWACFVNPLFCYPRGASTKLALPLSWRLPIATTRAGARGYRWNEELVRLAETPEELAGQAANLANLDGFPRASEASRQIAAASPTLEEISLMVAAVLREASSVGS